MVNLKDLLMALLKMDKLQEKGIEVLFGVAGWVCSNFARADSVDSELASLRDRAGRIKATLEDAEQRRYIEDVAVLNWLRELRAVTFDIDDLLDEFETKKSAHVPTVWLWYCYQVSKVIDDIDDRFKKIVQDKKDLALKRSEAPRRLKSVPLLPEAGSQRGALNVHGRDEEISKIIELLSSSSSRNGEIQVISIEGVGGIGKTTVAQRVFEETKSRNMFDKWIWVDMSQQFDAKRTIKEIITSLNDGDECPSWSLDLLQRDLQALLENSKFLLVLDSVWNEDVHFWDTLRIPLTAGRSGSRVLMTTRNRQVTCNMHAWDPIVLDKLDHCSNWQVLRDQAFVRGDHEDFPDLVRIGVQIAEKCDGSPLAAQLLGRLLNANKTLVDWETMLDEMPDPNEVVDKILPAIMRVSYDQLSLHLKHCFAYCSIFPKGYEFDKDELVKFWMAEGLIKCGRPRENLQIEDAGNKHFHELLGRSFFQPSSSNKENKYQMPSLIHDLAQSVSKYECLNINDFGIQHGKDAVRARYAFLSYSTEQLKNLELICNHKSLRTLLLHNEHDLAPTAVPSSLLILNCLRVLDMSDSQLEKLPDWIGNLIHLRYLGLRGTLLEILPMTIKKLHNLQTLELGECYKLKELPAEICSLTKLRHLGLHLDWQNWDSSAGRLTSMPPGIGKLTSLQTLSRFSVASEKNCGIDQLGKLKLRGELCISKLENVVGGEEEASKANLSQKRKVDFLMLSWSTNASSKRMRLGSANDVANGLQPHTNVKTLWIDNYMGTRFPDWMEDEAFAYLETIRLTRSGSCKIFPCVARLPRLKNLYIKGLHKVKRIPSVVSNDSHIGFPSLEVLCVSDMKKLEALFVRHDDHRIPSLPSSLRKLELRNCPKLILSPSTSAPLLHELVVSGVNWAVTGWFPQLKSLWIDNFMGTIFLDRMEDEAFACLETLRLTSSSSLEILPCAAKLPRLKNLYIKGLHKVKRIPSIVSDNSHIGFASLEVLCVSDMKELEALSVRNDGGRFPSLPSRLRKLELRNCPKLILHPSTSAPSLHELVVSAVNWAVISWFPQLTSLKSLTIMEIPTLKHIQTRPTRGLNDLQTLKITNCMSLRSLASGEDVLNLPSLKRMVICQCPKLGSLPRLPPNNRSKIMIGQCPLLEGFCERNGINYTKIEDID